MLGICADFHDSAAALVVGGRIVAAAEEERFTRVKHDASLPEAAVAACLEIAGLGAADLEVVAFHEKPLSAYERILVSHARAGVRAMPSLGRAIGGWSRRKLWIGYRVERMLRRLGSARPPRLTFVEHHVSHAASAFYPSPFERAAIITCDGVGEWTTSSIGRGDGGDVELLKEMRYPDSVGLLYSAVTSFCGFEVNDGEYKLMGLAPYGSPRYERVILDRLVHVADDGSVRLDMDWFEFTSSRRMFRPDWSEIFDGPARDAGEQPTQRDADLASSIQAVLARIVLTTARHAREITGERAVCLAGGVALNCVANRTLVEDGPFDEVWVQPAAGDAGTAVGSALWAYHGLRGVPRVVQLPDGMSGARLGPEYGVEEIAEWLRSVGVRHLVQPDLTRLCDLVAAAIDAGEIVGWFQGRMEFGPRALGGRSILADPRDPAVVARLNRATKRRESFRPFAPAVMVEHAHEWFDVVGELPYMLVTAAVSSTHPEGAADDETSDTFESRLSRVRSAIPAVTHVDGSARVQTVDRDRSPRFWHLLDAFRRRTGCPVLVNTSFNRRGEPIVATPADAWRCFAGSDIDLLVLGDCIVRRSEVALERRSDSSELLTGAGS